MNPRCRLQENRQPTRSRGRNSLKRSTILGLRFATVRHRQRPRLRVPSTRAILFLGLLTYVGPKGAEASDNYTAESSDVSYEDIIIVVYALDLSTSAMRTRSANLRAAILRMAAPR